MQYGEYTLSPDISPVTTADTAAELGLQAMAMGQSLRVSSDPPGTDREKCVPALPDHALTMARRIGIGRLPNSLDGFPAVPP